MSIQEVKKQIKAISDDLDGGQQPIDFQIKKKKS